ncbi:MAG: DUF378 domain-containing protein [Minisyncoccota bacterium]
MKNKNLHRIAFVLVIIGALNWGLIGIGGYMNSDWDVVKYFLGTWSWLQDLVYVLVGLSGLFLIFDHRGTCKMCATGSPAGTGMGA